MSRDERTAMTEFPRSNDAENASVIARRSRPDPESLSPDAHDGMNADAATFQRRIHGGAAAQGVLDFSVNLNPLGPPDSLALAIAPEHVLSYPEPESATLRQALAERHGVDAPHDSGHQRRVRSN